MPRVRFRSSLSNIEAMGFPRFVDAFSPRRTGRRLLVFVALAFAAGSFGLFAQTRAQSSTPPQSELGRQNVAHVAASVGQLVAVLHKDPGLMVELKRWIAKDATDHGQLIS